MNDPHASLQLFQSRDVNQEERSESRHGRAQLPRTQSMKPPPRDLSELFVDEASAAAGAPQEGDSPARRGIPVKSGGGRNHKTNRLFDDADDGEAVPVPSSVKTNEKKYKHFEFDEQGVEDDSPKRREGSRSSKSAHQTSWDFDDFNTPAKTKTKILGQNVRHFGWSDDEVSAYYKPEPLEVDFLLSITIAK